MLRNAVQPSLVSLFSSTSSSPFAVFSMHVDLDLPEDSGLILLRDHDDRRADIPANDATELQRDPRRFQLRVDAPGSGQSSMRGLLEDTVLHIQSPTIKTTFIRTPPLNERRSSSGEVLGLELPYLHLQFRPLGSKPFMVEVGVRDIRGKRARIRLSNFQAQPALYLVKAKEIVGEASVARQSRDIREQAQQSRSDNGPILHLPVALPADPQNEPTSFTPWLSVTLSLAKLMPHFNNPKLLALSSARALARPHGAPQDERDDPQESAPARRVFERLDRFHSIDYVAVHANLRLRRIWCSTTHDAATNQDELQVFAAALGP
ncbi:uncharacterized protein PFL1_00424 [Pseudozyma flocculosa PF-1]|uniref:CFA20 domain-containing protein n=1 Tax=Pseudozyma flocculosa TaxID=84751 RepID=A0A5C3ESX4_9BASI|nr:uncharacterized protein PFL1_00424 [Pseudozyma flocculosa PF-1]EPQ32227.1 hypothetical protein PFL1_00424 [Pseudozyma flocculosa PF-1]SPO34825.1 uncharacterized protein PSFLO_00296 [Pseudozyma flocculosa]